MTIDKFLFILALICFIIAVIAPFARPNTGWARPGWIALGLAFWVLTNII
jgi:hypothetical protein